jgi:hypothetical protein
MGLPSNNGLHHGSVPVIGGLDVLAKSGFGGSIVDGSAIRQIDGGSLNVELCLIGKSSWDKWAVGLVEHLVVYCFVIGFTIELGFEWEKVEGYMIVLVAFYVLEVWF